jgi:hypothetical protein
VIDSFAPVLRRQISVEINAVGVATLMKSDAVRVHFRNEKNATICQRGWMRAEVIAEFLQQRRADMFVAMDAGDDEHGSVLARAAIDFAADGPALNRFADFYVAH